MSDVTRRLLELLAHLQTGRRFSGRELAARLETSPRTLRRDVERLRDYGYPVTTQPGPGGYYQLAAGQALPPMVFDDEEAVATVVGLGVLAASAPDAGGIGSAADRAFGKVDQVLPKRLRARATAVRATVEAAAQAVPPVGADALATLAAAAARHEHATFRYTSRDGSTSQRRVEPYRQVHLHLRWYLLAWDRDRADWRTFRLDRISDITVPGTRFDPRPLPAESAAEYLRDKLAEPRHRTVVLVDAPADRVADALKFADLAIEPLGTDRCRITTWVDSFEWLVLNLAFLDADFTVEKPEHFRARCRDLATRLAHAARGPG
ncbi:helix-turn-helix transcriptional regulator [Saccharopolyspora hordei]|uniref:Putative DNA-binding transcriptional regulator YafY n=1 Tax=Saccharopolyspora hordei TaxID=1838 RepID=A0A853AS41_9PSEU|nr:YafY family protein [Saccharopolyspora hordei]NYI84537.1 putative DNA-binding transcriptional regulator YafY [Saccharopolyspora hordei]